MTESYLLAFVIAPLSVLCLGWTAVFLHKWSSARERRTTDA